MSDLIRIAAGQVAAYDLLNTSSYLVSNFPRQSDMTSAQYWSASQPNKMLSRETRSSLGVGGGNYYGGYNGEIAFFMLTEDMRSYIHETIMSSKPYARVTLAAYTDMQGFQVLTGELINPFATNAESSYETFGYELTHTNVYLFRRGSVLTVANLLAENSAVLITEDSIRLALEQQNA